MSSRRSTISAVCLFSNFVFPALDFAVGASLILYGVLAYNTTTFEDVILPIHTGVMGLIVVIFTFYIPKKIGVQIPFYLTFSGRGFCFLFFGGFVLDPFGFTVYGSIIGIGIILCAFSYFLIAILNGFEVIVIVLPPPVFQNDCRQTVSLTLAKQKSMNAGNSKYERMKDDSLDNEDSYNQRYRQRQQSKQKQNEIERDDDYFDDTI